MPEIIKPGKIIKRHLDGWHTGFHRIRINSAVVEGLNNYIPKHSNDHMASSLRDTET